MSSKRSQPKPAVSQQRRQTAPVEEDAGSQLASPNTANTASKSDSAMASQQTRKRPRLSGSQQQQQQQLVEEPNGAPDVLAAAAAGNTKLDRLQERNQQQEVDDTTSSKSPAENAVHELRASMRQRRTQQQNHLQQAAKQSQNRPQTIQATTNTPMASQQKQQNKQDDTAESRSSAVKPSPAPVPPVSMKLATAAQNICAACARPIKERYLLMALDKHWHEDCLKCACCDCRLGEVGSSLFTHSDKILCRRDFLRIFGQHGNCAACNRSIPPYEMVMRANELAYHMDCFACQQCQYRFCVGDRFHLTETHKIICLLCHTDQQQQQQQQAGQPTTRLIESTTAESAASELADDADDDLSASPAHPELRQPVATQPVADKAKQGALNTANQQSDTHNTTTKSTRNNHDGPLSLRGHEVSSDEVTPVVGVDSDKACSLPPASKQNQACAV